ncbi:lactoylglutathione lyase [Chlamydoabsidia padenii]|nr:lactoylglutathione lyase [Chlamydoabsidia padenii]
MSTDPSKYVFNHTMIRVKDPKASVDFYEKVLGMKNIYKMDNENGKFTLYFLAYVDSVPSTEDEKKNMAFSRPGILELTHNWGTENQKDFKYCTGNEAESKGFGHTAILVDDIKAACERFEQLKVNFIKRLTDGSMKNIAFITDPDGYWVEIIQNPMLSNKNTL